MSLDHLAETATRELLEQLPPDPERMLVDLKRTRRRRNVARSASAVAAVVLAAATVALVPSGDDTPEPSPAPRNGAMVAPPDTTAHAWRSLTDFGAGLELPQDAAAFVQVQFSADGSRLVYPGPRRTIRTVDVTSGDTEILGGCLDGMCYPALSPDGTRLAYGAKGHLKLQTIATGDAEPVLTPGIKLTSMPTWSPDGKAIAFGGPRGLYVVELDTGEVRQVHRYAGSPTNFVRPSWSPDGSAIAFLDERLLPGDPNHEASFTALTVGADGTDLREVHGAGHCNCLGIPAPSLTWSPDGELIAVAVTQGQGGAGIYTVRPDGTDWQMLHPGIYGDVDWQPPTD